MNKASEILNGVFMGLGLLSLVLAILSITGVLPACFPYIALGLAGAACAAKIVSGILKDTD